MRLDTTSRPALASTLPTVRGLVVGFLVLVANSAYLAARADASPFYFANVVLHMALGLWLLARLLLRPARGWRRWPRLLLAAAPLLALGAFLGLALMVAGATRPHRWLLYAHMASAGAGAVLVLFWLVRQAARRAAERGLFAALGVSAGALSLIAAAVAVPLEQRATRPAFRIANPVDVPASMEGEGAGPSSPFFPSSAQT